LSFTHSINKVRDIQVGKYVEFHNNVYSQSLRSVSPQALIGPIDGMFYFQLNDSAKDKEFIIIRSNEYQILSAIKTTIVRQIMRN